jgi:hypothetical protein
VLFFSFLFQDKPLFQCWKANRESGIGKANRESESRKRIGHQKTPIFTSIVYAEETLLNGILQEYINGILQDYINGVLQEYINDILQEYIKGILQEYIRVFFEFMP